MPDLCMHSKENFKHQWQCWNIYRWNKDDVWGLRFVREGRTHRWNAAGHEMCIPEAEWWSFITLLQLLLMFQVLHKKKKRKKKQPIKSWEIIFSLSFLGRLIIFHLTTPLNGYQSSTSTTLPPFCQQSLRILTESQSLNWQWRRLPATALKQFVKKLTNHGRLAAFKKRTIVFKKCLLPCILKQYLRDCFTQGRRALNQVRNSD